MMKQQLLPPPAAMRKTLITTCALLALAACSSDEYVGGTDVPSNGSAAINFTSDAGKTTRATSNSGTVSAMLDGQFKVYGVKNVIANNADAYSTVFPSYIAWNKNDLSSTTSNPDGNDGSKGWEYVGASSTGYGSGSETIGKEQTIKYWDYSAANYHFVAGSPVASFTYTITSNDIASATVTGLAGHITANTTETAITTNPVYIAEPVNVVPDNYQKPVQFTFVRQQTRVRVGIYETIPGYKITEIKFYPYDSEAWGTTSSTNIILASTTANYFVGGSSENVKGTVTYTWTGDGAPSYSFAYEDADASNSKTLTQAKNWYAGLLSEVKAVTSNHTTVSEFYGTDKDMDNTTGFFTVLPTPSATTASPLLIKCDYTLTSEVDNSGETINVKGATAAIPAAFCKWAPNTSYTYIFKISDNTNGYTGTTSQPGGLYPITFDAVTMTESNALGTITTVSTPSITTYQDGSVTETGIKYVKDKVIYITAQNNETGVLNDLTALNDASPNVGMVQVYVVDEGTTEADLILNRPNTQNKFATTIGSDAWTINGQSVAYSNWASFTPTVARTYAIEYITATNPVAYTYKVVHVE